jgi:hypothetical protein
MEVGEEGLIEVGKKRGKVSLESLSIIYCTPTTLFELLKTSRIVRRPNKRMWLLAR